MLINASWKWLESNHLLPATPLVFVLMLGPTLPADFVVVAFSLIRTTKLGLQAILHGNHLAPAKYEAGRYIHRRNDSFSCLI